LEAALALCTRGGLNQGLIRRVVGVYEATGVAVDRTGLYAEGAADDLLGRIVMLSDRFAALADALRPDEALRQLLVEHQESEPDLTRIFVSAVGLYPVGTVVQLESGAIGVVVEAPRSKGQLERPVVQIVEGGEQGLVDLSRDERYGKVVSTVPASEAKINVSHFFLL
jgi:hypothetical protein